MQAAGRGHAPPAAFIAAQFFASRLQGESEKGEEMTLQRAWPAHLPQTKGVCQGKYICAVR